MNFTKKIFSSFVALTTIAWSVGVGSLALPSMASAATAGQLIKASGPAVYYYANDAKRYVFPNEKTYFSWFTNFSSVQTITDSELASISIGGNVTIRPGTNLIKITTDPKVYAVAPNGVLRWIESEAIAVSLYGASWASRVVDVPDGYFVNYSVGASLSTAQHPDGTVVAYAGDSSRYVVVGGQKRKLVDPAFAANNYNPAFVITTSVSYPNGSDVTGREDALANVVNAGAGAAVTVGGSVSVSLASDTPAGQNVPQGASSIQLAKFNLTAGSASALVTGFTLRRVGIGSTSDFANVYLYKADGTRLTTGRTINSSTHLVQFNGLNLSIAAGSTLSVMVVGDTNSGLTAGGQHSFEISDAASIVVSGTGATVAGSFPVRGNVFTIGTTSASRLDVTKGTTPSNPQIGAVEAEISNFKLTAQGNDIEVRRVTLLQGGDIANTDVTNLKLYQGSTVVATTASLAGDKIVLNFSPAYLVSNGTTRVFSLKANVAGRTGRTIKTYAEYSTDVYAVDTRFGTGAHVCIDSVTAPCAGTFDGSATNFITVTTAGGQFTTTFNGPATADIAKGGQDVSLFKFAVTASDSLLEIRKMYFTLTGLTGADKVKGTSATEYFRDLKIKNLDTGVVLMGPISMPAATASPAQSTGLLTFTDAFNVPAGTTLNLAFTADLTNSADDVADEFSADGNNQYRVIMANGSGNLYGSSDIRLVNTGEYLTTGIVPNSTINGNPMTVKSSNLNISLAASPTAGTAVKKEALIPSAGFVFTAGSQSAITIRSVKLTGRADVAVPATYALADLKDAITSCALFDGSTQVGLAQSPDVTAGTMNITNMSVVVPAGTSKTLVAKCTADSLVSGASDSFAVGIAGAADVTADDSDSNTVTPGLSAQVINNSGAGPTLKQTVMSGGTLTLASDNLRQSTILVAGGDVWQNLAQFKATAQFEAMKIERLAVTSTGDAANFSMIAVAKDGVVVGSDVFPSGVAQTRDIDLTSNPINVPKDGNAVFQIWAKLGNVQASSSVSGATSGVVRSGNQVALGLNADVQTGNWSADYSGMFNARVVGLASGDLVYSAGTATVGNAFVIRKSKPTVTRQALSTTTLSNGSSQDLYRMQVSADSAGSVAVKKISFDFSKTGVTTLSNFRVRKGSTDMPLASYAIADDTLNDLTITTIPGVTTAGRIVVTFVNEETITGSGNVYTLYATPAASVAGDTVSIAPTRNIAGSIVTGYLEGTVIVGGSGTLTNDGLDMTGANLDTDNDGTADAAGTFVWSDLSEVPHSYATPGSSFDWTNDVYVEDLTQTQSLSR